MSDQVELRMSEAAVPLCREFLAASFYMMDEMDPIWQKHGINIYSSKLLYGRTLFHFAAVPMVLTSRTAYQRLPKPTAEKLTSVLIRAYVPPLIDLFVEKAEITDADEPGMYREEFQEIIKEHALAYADHDDATAALKAAVMLGGELVYFFEEVLQQEVPEAATGYVPATFEQYLLQVIPKYLKTANVCIDACLA